MKLSKITLLYLIFVILFLFGDLISTDLVLERRESAPGEVIPEKCRVTLPPECDISPILREEGTVRTLPILVPKVGAALIMGIVIYFGRKNRGIYYSVLAINAALIWVVLSNFSISFWKYAWLFGYAAIILIYLLLSYFTEVKDDL